MATSTLYLEFQMISLGTGGYLSDLLFELRRVTSEASKIKQTFHYLKNGRNRPTRFR